MAKSKVVTSKDLVVSPENFYSTFVKHPPGEQVLLSLDAMFNANSSFVPGDPNFTSYKEGQRSVVLFIYQQLVKSQIVQPIKQQEDGE